MPKKQKMFLKEPRYRNIPVTPDTYAKIELLSEAQGFGERGKGAYIGNLVDRELPECSHEKTPVAIEYFPGETQLLGFALQKVGYFCATCQRVYAKIETGMLTQSEVQKVLQAVRLRHRKEGKG